MIGRVCQSAEELRCVILWRSRPWGVLVALFGAFLVIGTPARGELSDLHLRTLELAAEAKTTRGLELRRALETSRWPMVKLRARASESLTSFDPRPALKADAPLYRALGLLPAGEEGREQLSAVTWPVIPAAYFAAQEPPDQLVVARGRAEPFKLAHAFAVGLAVLEQHHSTSLAGQGNRDRQLAGEAFFLGDAVLFSLSRSSGFNHGDLETRRRWAQQKLMTMLESGQASPGRPSFSARLIAARFVEGLDAAIALRGTSPWGVVDQLYKRGLPRSTAQLLHPRLLLEDRQNREVVPLSLSALEGRGEPGRGVLGELRLRLWLERFLSAEVAERAAAGWAGDGYLLYPGQSNDLSTLVLLTAWDRESESAIEEARDFAGAVGRSLSKIVGDGAQPQAEGPSTVVGYRDAAGRRSFVEHREDKVLIVIRCPADLADRVREEVWSSWRVGRPDLGMVGEIRAAPPELVVSLPPEVPWYRRTPGVVALLVWLLVVLPGSSFVISRRVTSSPVTLYLLGTFGTVLLIVLGWFLGY